MENERKMRSEPYTQGRTQGKDWSWDEVMVAEMAIVSYRKEAEARRAVDDEAKEFGRVLMYVHDMGFWKFSETYLREAFLNWWYCIDAEDAYRDAFRR